MTENEREVQEIIRRAFDIDKRLPPVFKKYNARSYLGNLIVIPDMRNANDIVEEAEQNIQLTREDYKLWDMVINDWIPILPLQLRELVKRRGSRMGWKRIMREMGMGRTKAIMLYQQGLALIVEHNKT